MQADVVIMRSEVVDSGSEHLPSSSRATPTKCKANDEEQTPKAKKRDREAHMLELQEKKGRTHDKCSGLDFQNLEWYGKVKWQNEWVASEILGETVNERMVEWLNGWMLWMKKDRISEG